MAEVDPDQIDYLTEEEALAVVDRLGFHVRDMGLLGSALARPRASAFGEDAYPDLITKAAAMFESLVRNHALFDGNKRLSVVLTWTFLLNNGARLVHGEDEAYDFVVATAAGERTLQEIGEWFAHHVQPDVGP